MADAASKVDKPVITTPKAKKLAAARKPATHPPIAEMVNCAISTLKERGGSSLQEIKRFVGANYQADSEKLAPFIKKYLRSSVTNGSLIQVKGQGASGSFKLAVALKKAKGPGKKNKKVSKSPKKKKEKKPAEKPAVKIWGIKVVRLPPTHPPIAEMVDCAISKLKERGGSSTESILYFINSNYETNPNRLAPHIIKYIKSAVANGSIRQLNGKCRGKCITSDLFKLA